MNCGHIWFSGHAVKRMFDRGIQHNEVVEVARCGEVIADYPDDTPYPSRLMLEFVHGRPLHVVVAIEAGSESCYIITAYDPDPDLWEENFRVRKSK